MEITYQIEPEDFVAFNLSYMNGSSVMRASIRNTRLICAGIVAVGGCLLMYMLHSLNAISAIAYIALAAVIYALMPRFMVRKVRKGVLRMLARPQNKDICSELHMSVNNYYSYGILKILSLGAVLGPLALWWLSCWQPLAPL